MYMCTKSSKECKEIFEIMKDLIKDVCVSRSRVFIIMNIVGFGHKGLFL
jgi:hypothetical protein